MAVAETLKLIITADVSAAVSSLDKVKKNVVDLQKVGQQMVKVGKVMSVGITAPLVLLGRQAVKSAGEQEQAEAALAAVLRATGGDVDSLMKDYNAFASSIQNVTTVGDEQVLGLLQQAKSFGIVDERMKEAVSGAIGLNKAFGIDMESALRGVANAMEGNYGPLERYIVALRVADTESEKAAALQKAMADGFEVARSEALTGTGQMMQLTNTLGDLGEIVGKIIIPALNEMGKYLKEMAEWFTNLNPAWQETIIKALGLAAALGPLLLVGGKLLGTVPKVTDAFNKLGEMFGLTGGQVALIVVALMALATLTVIIIKNWGPISDFFVNLWTDIKQAFWDAYQSIRQIVNTMYEWMIDKLEAMVAPIRKVAEKIKGAFIWLKNELVGQSVIPDMVDMVGAEMVRMNRMLADPAGADELAANIEKARKTAASATAVITSFGDSFATALLSAEDFGDALKIGMRSAIASMLQMLAEYAFVQAGIAFAEVLKGNLTQIPAVAAWTSAGTAALVAAGAVKAMAEGGIVTRPTMALVGERGPEAVIPLSKAGGMMPVVNVYVQGSVLEEEGLARRITKVVQGAGRGY